MADLLPSARVPVVFGDQAYMVTEWVPGAPVPRTPAVALDTETLPIVKGEPLQPAIVQAAFQGSDSVLFARPEHFGAFMSALDQALPDARFVFFNAPFDCQALGWPGEPLWKIFTENRLVDMEVRGILHTLQEGTYMDKMNLEMLTKLLLHTALVKDDRIRLSFAPGQTLTVDQVVYAAQDSLATLGCWERLPEALPTEEINLRGSFALKGISDRGLRRDEVAREILDKKLLEEQLHQRSILKLFGISPAMVEIPDSHSMAGVVNRKQQLLEALEQQYGLELKRSSKSKNIVTEKKSLDLQLIAAQVPVPIWIQASRNFDHARKIRSTYLREDMIGKDGRVHPRFTPLVRTGRTSCSEPNIQNVPRLGGVREIYYPEDGHIFMATDYSQLELCALSESCYQRFGKSVMGDLINQDMDVHLWFGCILGHYQKKEFDPNDKKHKVTKQLRQTAKAFNFGAPGGLGSATFVAFAANYGVTLTVDEAKELLELWFEHFPEMRDHLRSDTDELWTTRNVKTFLSQHDFNAPYVSTVSDLGDFLRCQKWTEQEIRGALSDLVVYQVRTVSGRLKRNCSFCSAANLQFQGPSADGAKIALWEGYKRGWRVVNFIHDELLQEVRNNLSREQLTLFVEEVESVMCSSMTKILPHMKIKAESALMTRWYKEAEPCKDKDGYPTIWMPPAANLPERLKVV